MAEELGDAPEAEEGCKAAAAPVRGALTVSAREWDLIADLPPHTRLVGAMFQQAAREICGVSAPAPKHSFDVAAFEALQGRAPTPSTNKAVQLKAKLMQKTLAEDCERAKLAATKDTPPRREVFGGRMESYIYALLSWVKARRGVASAVASKKLLEWLDLSVDGTPLDILKKLRDRSERGNSLQSLREICDDESVLGLEVAPAELRLRPEQAEFARAVRAACCAKTGALISYKTPPSGGKSSACALLGSVLADQKDTYIIYACYSRPVRIDVCKHLVAACVPFAILVQGIATPHCSCFFGPVRSPAKPPPPDLATRAAYSLHVCACCDRRPVVLVCDLVSTELLLRHRSTDVLLFDEPTADVVRGMRDDVQAVLRMAPSITVLMSATIPPLEAMQKFVCGFQSRHPGAQMCCVSTQRLAASVTALRADGQVLAPHVFGTLLSDIRASGHLQRFYSPRVLAAMQPAEGELAVRQLLSYEGIRAACIDLLGKRGLPLLQPPKRPELLVDKMCGEQAWMLPGATLVVLGEPDDFHNSIQQNLSDLPSLRRILKSAEVSKKPVPRQAKDHRPPSQEVDNPTFPIDFVVNSKEHLERFKADTRAFPKRLFRGHLLLSDQVTISSETRLVEAALSGVLFLGNPRADSCFEASSQTLGEKALESFLVGGKILIYGLNLPLDRLVVGCRSLSRAELEQLCGRVGRTCRASVASEIIFLEDHVARDAMTVGEPDRNNIFDI